MEHRKVVAAMAACDWTFDTPAHRVVRDAASSLTPHADTRGSGAPRTPKSTWSIVTI
jgi:hypothetical protein